jgi:hypothetical protein
MKLLATYHLGKTSFLRLLFQIVALILVANFVAPQLLEGDNLEITEVQENEEAESEEKESKNESYPDDFIHNDYSHRSLLLLSLTIGSSPPHKWSQPYFDFLTPPPELVYT